LRGRRGKAKAKDFNAETLRAQRRAGEKLRETREGIFVVVWSVLKKFGEGCL